MTWSLAQGSGVVPGQGPLGPMDSGGFGMNACSLCTRSESRISELMPEKGLGGVRLGGSAIERLPLAQGVILGSGIESRIGLPEGSLLLPLSVSHE